jgi:hypothetical protein
MRCFQFYLIYWVFNNRLEAKSVELNPRRAHKRSVMRLTKREAVGSKVNFPYGYSNKEGK